MRKIAEIVVIAYVVVAAVIFAPYYNWQYSKDNGFVRWLILGQYIPTLKAAVWPYYVFFHDAGHSKTYFINSLKHSNLAATLSGDKHFDAATKKRMMEEYEEAWRDAQQVNSYDLNRIYPNLGNNFENYYIKGINLINVGSTKHDLKMLDVGIATLNKWDEWYDCNFHALDSVMEDRI